ncbi:acyl carrier protein [Saccharibacillus sp. O23]|uniref:phosphopantetheine-binding protein n=1 Tax=Saccharibacillus sp. O23 TaxID=2009338 RepID=UPI000B4E4D19|nr:phosphopantetheine-binding protein [Saccharibacillus sp. O23]OWR33183.1 acyl carrier protein [Saccharibacillus sp. O23]
MANEQRCEEVRDMLLEELGLDDVEPGGVDYDSPLFAGQDAEGSGLGLDSVDALEVVVALKTRYGLTLKDEDKPALRSIATLAAYIDARLSETVS